MAAGAGAFQSRARGGRRAGHGHPRHLHHHLPRGGLFGQGERDHRGLSDGKAVQAGADALRRHPHGAKGLRGQRLSCGPGGRGIFYNTPQNAQRGRVRRIYARNAGLPLQPYHHRPAGRLRPGPHHRRLPPCGAVRRGPADRGQTAPEGHHPRHHVFRRHPRAGGAQRADPRAGRLEKAGGDLRLRYLPSGEGHP